MRIDRIYLMKINHHLVLDILQSLCGRISAITSESDLHACSTYDAMLQAAKYGIVEFIDSMRLANPDLLWANDKDKRGVFSHAIVNRQEKVFQLIHNIEGLKEFILSQEDVYGNNMLHLAAESGPSFVLGDISHGVLQMEREFEWFKVVERIVPLKYKEAMNKNGEKPRELFTKTHKELLKDGGEWLKGSASTLTVMASLIIGIMFTVVFTVPGGYNQVIGVPLLADEKGFTIFIVAAQCSFITSLSSLVTCLGLLTSRYIEEDFYQKGISKLVYSFQILCLSMIFMMTAFATGIDLMLKGNSGHDSVLSWPMIILVFPVCQTLSALMDPFIETRESVKRLLFLASKKQRSHFSHH